MNESPDNLLVSRTLSFQVISELMESSDGHIRQHMYADREW